MARAFSSAAAVCAASCSARSARSPGTLGIGGRSFQPGRQHGGLLLGTDARLALDLQQLTQPLSSAPCSARRSAWASILSRAVASSTRAASAACCSRSMRCAWSARSALCCRGLARQGIALAGQSGHLLNQFVLLALQGLPGCKF